MKWHWFGFYLWTPAGNKQNCRLLFLCSRKSMVRYSMEHFTFIWGRQKKMTALKQKTGKKGDWFGSPTPCLWIDDLKIFSHRCKGYSSNLLWWWNQCLDLVTPLIDFVCHLPVHPVAVIFSLGQPLTTIIVITIMVPFHVWERSNNEPPFSDFSFYLFEEDIKMGLQ